MIHVYWHTTSSNSKDLKLKNVSSSTSESVYDICQYVTQIQWSGNDTEASRSITVSVANDPLKPEQDCPELKNGDRISLYDGAKRLFFGRITYKERIGEVGTRSYTAKDYLNAMLKCNVSHKYKNKTAAAIAKDVIKRCGLKYGSISSATFKIGKLYISDTPAYNIMMKAFKMASQKNGIQYMPYMDGAKVCIKQKGQLIGRSKNSNNITTENYILSQDNQIYTSKYTENVGDMVNAVAIYNKKGKLIGSVTDNSDIKKFGKYQKALTIEKGNGRKEAKNSMVDITKELTLEALGDVRCISGAGIKVYDEVAKITGYFWIKSDTHTFVNGIHKMSLTLTFKNTTENPNVTTSTSSSSSTSSAYSTSTDAEKVVNEAKKWVGKVKYVYGATDIPGGKSDCSAFTQYVYKHSIGKALPRTCWGQREYGSKVTKISKLKPGDLVLMNTDMIDGHIGIYIGNYKIIHCGCTHGVHIDTLRTGYFRRAFHYGRHIV